MTAIFIDFSDCLQADGEMDAEGLWIDAKN